MELVEQLGHDERDRAGRRRLQKLGVEDRVTSLGEVPQLFSFYYVGDLESTPRPNPYRRLRPLVQKAREALPDEDAVRATFGAFTEHGVRFTIATDGPEMMRTHLRDEFELLLRIGAVDESQLGEANSRGHEPSFVRGGSV